MTRAKAPFATKEIYRVLAEKLKLCRTGAGLSQREMAVAIGLKPLGGVTTVSSWERGVKRPTLSWIEAYAYHTQAELGWFFTDENRKFPRPSHLQLGHLESDQAIRILRSMIENTLEIATALPSEPKVEMTKRRLKRIIEDLTVEL